MAAGRDLPQFLTPTTLKWLTFSGTPAVSLRTLQPFDDVCTMPMTMTKIGEKKIGGRLLVFGHCPHEEIHRHVLTIYAMLEDGKKYYFNNEVTDKMHDLELVFNFLKEKFAKKPGVAEANIKVIQALGEIIPGFNMQTDRSRPELFAHPGLAIVGEPTGMQPAVAEKGLMVVDMTAHGVSGHAARDNGVNAIYKALDDIQWIRDYKFKKISELLGPTKMTLTVINAGTQHNVVPDECRMVIDIRTNERYTNEEVFDIIQRHVSCEVKARSDIFLNL